MFVAATLLVGVLVAPPAAADVADWNVTGTYTITFTCTAGCGGDYPHTLDVTLVNLLSDPGTFSGSGFYQPDASYTWDVTGTVSGSDVTFHILYTGTGAGYTVDGVGTIALDGSMSGTAGNASQSFNWVTSGDTATQVTRSTEVVKPGDMKDWVFLEEIPEGEGTLVTGSEAAPTPPLGDGSARFVLNDTGREILATAAYAGTRLDEITGLAYSSYRSSADAPDNLAVTLQFDVDYDLTDASTAWQGRLVFEPVYTTGPGGVPEDTWQTWDPMAGKWWATGAPGNTVCGTGAVPPPCTWAQILSNFPDAGIRNAPAAPGALFLKAGGPVPGGFDANADALAIGIGSQVTTFDFEPGTIPGTWTLTPEQTGSSVASDETVYKTLVRQPINAVAPYSNFPKRRGVVPVQFDLHAATTTTTVTTFDDPVFGSVISDNPSGAHLFGAAGEWDNFGTQANDYGVLRFVPDGDVALKDLTELRAFYEFTTGDCIGGSLRWSIRLDANGDGVDSAGDRSLWIYFGALSFDDCTSADIVGTSDIDMSGENMLWKAGGRYEGPGWLTYGSQAPTVLGLGGGWNVLRASLVVDSGWDGCPNGGAYPFDPLAGPTCNDQVIDLGDVLVDRTPFVPKTTETSVTTGPYVKTCDLPDAEIWWQKNDPEPTGAVNEAVESVQLKDAGTYFRIIDCKYIYNLDVSSLDPNLATRAGTYFVWAKIGGEIVSDSPARFDLR